MRTVTTGVRRRLPLLTGIFGLCLVVLAGPSAAASRHVALGAGDAITAAVADVAVAARSSADRLTPAHRSGLNRQVPPSATLPAAVLLAFLLAARGRRDTVFSTPPRSQLLRVAGRGPPVLS